MFTSILSTPMTVKEGLICCGVALLFGIFLALIYNRLPGASKSFTVSLFILPVLCQGLFMLINGQIGIAISIAGVFSLIRFRSVPANAKDIVLVMAAMFAGLASAVGQLYFGATIVVLVGGLILLLYKIRLFGGTEKKMELRVKTPEDLDYAAAFDDVFAAYTKSAELKRAKTTNLGSLNELTYLVELKDPKDAKKFIDELRFLNGNLPISLSATDPGETL